MADTTPPGPIEENRPPDSGAPGTPLGDDPPGGDVSGAHVSEPGSEPQPPGAQFRGVGPALVTPMQADGSIDLYALADHAAWVLHAGVHMLVPCGTTGESATLSPDEQKEIIACCVEIADGRVPVLAGAGGNETAVVASLAAAAAQAGADGLLTVTPYYNKPPLEGLIEHYAAVHSASGLPVILYNVPSRTGANVAPLDILRIAEAVPGVVGVKEASGSIRQITTLLASRPEGFTVLAGDDEIALPLLALGGDGVISVVANEAPGPMTDLFEATAADDWAEARRLHAQLLPLMRANFLTTNPIPVKTALELMGRAPAQFRLPLRRLGARDENRTRLRTALESAGLIEPFVPPTP